jgi:hypothetical protein
MKKIILFLDIGELILKILKGDHDPMFDNYSIEIRTLCQDMLNIDSSQRPTINSILERPFMTKYIKLNLIRQLSNKQTSFVPFLTNELNNSENQEKSDKTRSNSSDSVGLNLKFNSAQQTPSQVSSKSVSQSHSNLNSFSNPEEINVYKIDSENSSKTSTSRLTNGNKQKPITNGEYKTTRDDKNSVFTKIEKLKKFLENFLGLENFLEIYFKINVSL